ncbi:hypothetical protein SORBI_3002G099932 [Sorghum bicolor]|uniref:Uncharacterized protein n=1 Tax=Sorghum bicolor TaxID=4558 RepID=A0A1W0W361_SORBI|nr:hypothetical protein SORBI_3002G099932 [Sorghum bicolor]
MDNKEVPKVAVDAVTGADAAAAAARVGGAEHRRIPADPDAIDGVLRRRQLGQFHPVAGDGVPDGEVQELGKDERPGEEDAAVAGVDGVPGPASEVRVARPEGRGGREAGPGLITSEDNKTQHRGPSVELAEPAAEAAVGKDAAPELADEGGADEARGVVRWEAEEERFDELVQLHQRRRPRRHSASSSPESSLQGS